MASQYYKVTAYVGTPHRNAVEVTIPLVGPAGPQGPAGEAGAGAVESVNGQTGVVVLAAVDVGAAATLHASQHEIGGSDVLELDSQQILVDSVFLSTASEGLAGIYLRNGSDNAKPLYENAEYRTYIWWDSGQSKWFLTSDADVNLFESSSNTTFPWQGISWSAISPQTGSIDVDQAQLFDVSDQSIGNPSLLRTPKSGNATSTELVLGSDTRLTNSRTPSSTLAHAASHHTGGTDALTPVNIGAAAAAHTHAAADITSGTLDVARLPVGTGSTNVLAPTIVDAKGDLIVASAADTVARLAVGGTNGHVLTVDSAETLGVKWAAAFNPASPGAIGGTTAAAGSFTTLTSTVNSLATTPTQGVKIQNSTAAASGAQQVSPFLSLAGQGWNTTSSASQETEFAFHVLPAQGSTVTQRLELRSRVGGGAFANTAIFHGPNFSSGTVFTLSSAFGTTTFSRGSSIFYVDTVVEMLGGSVRLSSGGGSVVTLATDGSHTFAQRDGSNGQTFRLYNTFTDASNYERGFLRWNSNVLQIGTEKGSGGGTARALEFQTDGVTRMGLSTAGVLTLTTTNTLTVTPNATSIMFGGAACIRLEGVRLALATGGTDRFGISGGGDVSINTSNTFSWLQRGNISWSADGVMLLRDNASTAFDRLQFGGTTTSFPALKRSSTVLQARLANDSDFCPLQGQLRIHQNAVAETPAATHTMTLFDAAGTAYKVLCVAA